MNVLYDRPVSVQDPISHDIFLKLIYKLDNRLDMTSMLVSRDFIETAVIADYIYVVTDEKLSAAVMVFQMVQFTFVISHSIIDRIYYYDHLNLIFGLFGY